jgi:hypothetical protein
VARDPRRTARKLAIHIPPRIAQRFERDISRGPSFFVFPASSWSWECSWWRAGVWRRGSLSEGDMVCRGSIMQDGDCGSPASELFSGPEFARLPRRRLSLSLMTLRFCHHIVTILPLVLSQNQQRRSAPQMRMYAQDQD